MFNSTYIFITRLIFVIEMKLLYCDDYIVIMSCNVIISDIETNLFNHRFILFWHFQFVYFRHLLLSKIKLINMTIWTPLKYTYIFYKVLIIYSHSIDCKCWFHKSESKSITDLYRNRLLWNRWLSRKCISFRPFL